MHKDHSTTAPRKQSTQARRRATLKSQETQTHITTLIKRLLASDEEKVTAVHPADRMRWDTTQAKVRGLVERILIHEDNDQGLALVALLDLLTYEREGQLDREAIGIMAMNHALTQTLAFANFASAFRGYALNMADA